MTGVDHEALRDRLLELACDELPAREARRVLAHVETCEACRAELTRLRSTRRLMSALPPEPAPGRGEAVLLAAARVEADRLKRARPAPILPGWLWGFSAAAVAVLAVGAVSYRTLVLERERPERPDVLAMRAPVAEKSAQPAAAPAAEPDRAAAAGQAAPADRPLLALAPRSRSREEAARPAEREDRGAEGRAMERPAFAQAPPPAEEESPPAEEESPVRGGSASRAEEALADASGPAAGAAPPPAAATPRPAPSREDAFAGIDRARSAGKSARAEPALVPGAADLGALSRHAALRAAGELRGEVRTFPGCEGERWRKVELDAGGRVVAYVREGRIGGAELRVEHYFDGDGALGAVRVVRGGAATLHAGGAWPDLPGLPLRAIDSGIDAAPRCEGR